MPIYEKYGPLSCFEENSHHLLIDQYGEKLLWSSWPLRGVAHILWFVFTPVAVDVGAGFHHCFFHTSIKKSMQKLVCWLLLDPRSSLIVCLCHSRCPLQEDTPTTKPTCGPPVRSRLTCIAGAPRRTSWASRTTARRATRDAGAARQPAARRTTLTANGGGPRICIRSSRFRGSRVMRTISSALAATKSSISSTRRRWPVQCGALSAPRRSLSCQRCSSSTSSYYRISRSRILNASLKRWDAALNTASVPRWLKSPRMLRERRRAAARRRARGYCTNARDRWIGRALGPLQVLGQHMSTRRPLGRTTRTRVKAKAKEAQIVL